MFSQTPRAQTQTTALPHGGSVVTGHRDEGEASWSPSRACRRFRQPCGTTPKVQREASSNLSGPSLGSCQLSLKELGGCCGHTQTENRLASHQPLPLPRFLSLGLGKSHTLSPIFFFFFCFSLFLDGA
jgi:hypothetical protein